MLDIRSTSVAVCEAMGRFAAAADCLRLGVSEPVACRPRMDAPTPRRWVEAAISHIGYEATQTPYW